MRHFLLAAMLALTGAILGALPANAQATRTWVSGVGDDANPCSRTAPCKTFAGAISKTLASGEISCLDPGGFGALTITKSISIVCPGIGGVLAAGTNGININDSGSASPGTAVVYLDGLDIDGAGTGLIGINFISGAALHVKNSTIRNFNSGAAHGISMASNTAARLVVENSTISDTGTGAVGAGILIRPGPVGITGIISRVVISRSVFGVASDGNFNASSTMNITVEDSVINGATQAGLLVTTGANGAGMMVSRTSIVNSGTGLSTSGSGAVLRIGSSEITGNGTGVSGTVLSYGNNQLNGNGSDGTLTPVPGGLR